ncbi:nucleoside diphosphate kinase homolog 7 isoform X4 [Periplaneta americana]|uniref:nucleoside diphosphate kinase homolog 7 isoform X4 n=1 Tax=Periplaneta americana TaxID=6978 RepID=UPI0037E9228F
MRFSKICYDDYNKISYETTGNITAVFTWVDVDNSRYSFNLEWHDTDASIIRTFLLFYYKVDGTIELYDTKHHRMFLKRTKCDTVTLGDLHIGATVSIFSRQMKVASFGDEYTQIQLGVLKQRFLIEYMTSGPVVAMELLADNGVKKWRELLGPTDSEQARKDAPSSIRARFGKDKSYNAAHGSDSCESAERELDIFFPESQIARYESPRSTVTFKNTTCCIIKPHAVQEGLVGDIISEIQENGFKITALQMFYMEHPNAEEFYEVYKGVVAEYSGMVSQLISGPCVVMEVTGPDSDTPSRFRAFVGPSDPELARKLRPNTLRARYGKTKVQNAVHCTDLPEDGLLEVEYFFKLLE